jgi:arabinose-5-phosphate isomerase
MAGCAWVQEFKRVLGLEIQALQGFASRLASQRLKPFLECLRRCRGKVVTLGVGKSGLVARKIAATLSSTGTPALYLNAAECAHGDLGTLSPSDVVWVITNSGKSPEILTLLPFLETLGCQIVAMVGHASSPVSKVAREVIFLGELCEADAASVVPTVSTTLMMAIGDAVAISLMMAKGVSKEDFARWHPGGWLGRHLTAQVKHLCHAPDSCPMVAIETPLKTAIQQMTSYRLGCLVSDLGHQQYGIFTDGDLRRALEHTPFSLDQPLKMWISRRALTIEASSLAHQALRAMELHKITQLVVVDSSGNYAGVIHIHDLLGVS